VSVEVVHDGEGMMIRERCCICRESTNYWFTAKDVAVCQRCAQVVEAKDLPTKKQWCHREDLIKASRKVRLPEVKLHARVYRFPCPRCKAAPDERCKTATTNKNTDPHAAREWDEYLGRKRR
jgi:hypothetical protein